MGAPLRLVRCLRGDIARCVSPLASCIEYWVQEHTGALRSLIGRKRGTTDFRVVMQFCKMHAAGQLPVYVWSDSSPAAPKSITGCYMAMADSSSATFMPLSWVSKRQATTATPSASAEYVAPSTGVEMAVPVREAAVELGVSAKGPVQARCGNTAVLIAVNRGWAPCDALLMSETKTVKLRVCQSCDPAEQGLVAFDFDKTIDVRSDPLTKILTSTEDATRGRELRRMFTWSEIEDMLKKMPQGVAHMTLMPTWILQNDGKWKVIIDRGDGITVSRIRNDVFEHRELGDLLHYFIARAKWHGAANKDGDVLRRALLDDAERLEVFLSIWERACPTNVNGPTSIRSDREVESQVGTCAST